MTNGIDYEAALKRAFGGGGPRLGDVLGDGTSGF
jgi:hypothetical protein